MKQVRQTGCHTEAGTQVHAHDPDGGLPHLLHLGPHQRLPRPGLSSAHPRGLYDTGLAPLLF